MKKIAIALFLFSSYVQAQPTSFKIDKLLFSDDFEKGLDTSSWVVEKSTRKDEKVVVQQGKLVLDTHDGVTVWLRKEWKGNILISYKRTIIMNGGKNDRVSDVNQFWMATDPKAGMTFNRKGEFKEYDFLSLYYVGMGGNDNSTTRFRKYSGTGEKKILKEYTDAEHVLKPNKEYFIQIMVKDGVSKFFVDGQEYFSFTDPQPLTHGWFAFRSTHSRQEVDEVRVYRLR